MAGKRKSNLSEVNKKTQATKAARSQKSSPQLKLRKTKSQRQTKTSKSLDRRRKLHAQYLASQQEICELAKWRANSKIGGIENTECPSTMDTKCNYIGCHNTFKDSVMFRYPVDDWKRLNLWLLHSGNLTLATTDEFRDKYICCNHFPPSELKNVFGVTSLVKGAVPRHYLMSGANEDEEQNSLQVKKSTKAYPKTMTYVLKNFAKKGDVTQMDAKFNGTNLNMLLNKVTHKEDQKEKVSVYTIDANGMLTDNKTDNKNTDKHIFAITEDSTEIEVKKEIEEVESNAEETDNDQELDTAVKIEAPTDLQIKIEPTEDVEINLENDLDKVKIELEISPETNEEMISLEKVVVKVEPFNVKTHVRKETNAVSNVVVDIKSEWNECSDTEVECGDPRIECGETRVECSDPGVKNSNVLNTEAQGVELRNIDDKQNKRGPRSYDERTSEWCCGSCDARYPYKFALQRHRVARHGASKNVKRIFTVPDASKQLGQQSESQYRLNTKHFKCDVCSKRFKYEFMMIAHKKEHGATDLRCDLCNRECKTKRGLAKHINIHTKERVFSCPTCGETFFERSRLLNHMIKHLPDEKFPCDGCEMHFKSAAELEVHSGVHRTSFSCKVCGAEFPEESGLDEHMEEHTKSLECSVCLEQFTDIDDMQRHADMHQDMLKKVQVTSHSCPQCGKRFLYRSLLVTHQRVHSGERPFACDRCPKRFKTISASNEHARGHQMMFKCPDCDKSFARSVTLQLHRRRHTGERPYCCHLCHKSFAQRVSMTYHLKKFHAEPKSQKKKKAAKTQS